ncbi:hypothetical protein LCGC14_3106690 [marine sediment metagenome]|uniref:Uncharacterized protein n=1 Tax=marine sediment metagenome TaxID=412755 RepID=A0A0F8W6K2_9ZZZZ
MNVREQEYVRGFDAAESTMVPRATEDGKRAGRQEMVDWMTEVKIAEECEANAQLIAAAPIGDELSKAVINASATWIDDDRLEIGEAEYIELKKIAIRFRDKAEGKA